MSFLQIRPLLPYCWSILITLLSVRIEAKTIPSADSISASWTKKADFPSSSRNYGLGFSIGNKGYYGMGQKQIKPFIYKTYPDLWEYDPANNSWTQKADFPGTPRLMSQGFSANDKIYIGFGYVIAASGPNAGANDYQTDFFEFDPANNTWSKKSNAFLGRGDIFFVANNTVYAVNPEFRTVNRYTSETDTWFENKWEKEALSPNYTELYGGHFDFIQDGKEYMISVLQKKEGIVNQLWELDPTMVSWKLKNDLPLPGNDSIQTLSVGEKNYAILGGKKILEYDSKTDQWTLKKEIPSEHKSYLPLFSLRKKSYGFSKFEFWEYSF